MIIGVVPLSAFALETKTTSITDAGLVTYSENFETFAAKEYSANTNIDSFRFSRQSTGHAKAVIQSDSGKYLELQALTTDNQSPTLKLFLYNDDSTTNPLVNSIADAKSYKVKFRAKFSGEADNIKGGGTVMYMYLGGHWAIMGNSAGTQYRLQANAKDANETQYSGYYTVGNWQNFEIEVNKADPDNVLTSMKINNTAVFENLPKSTSKNMDLNVLHFKGNKKICNIAIDDIEVIVDSDSVCSDENWQNAENIDFNNDFTIGKIGSTPVGGFTNNDPGLAGFYSYVDYSYDPTAPAAVDKYLTLSKTTTDKAVSVQRDISDVVSKYSVYELSFKVKNNLDSAASTVIIKDGDGLGNGMAFSFTKSGTVSYFDYAKETPQTTVSDVTIPNGGDWVDVKFKIYKNVNKADLYVADMTTPVATGITTKHEVGGRTFVDAPQKSATGAVCVKDISITGIEEDDYVFTYNAGSTDKSKYIGGNISAVCKVAAERTAPAVLIAEYNADGTLANVAHSAAMDEAERTVTATLSGAAAASGNTVKIMLWDSLDGLYPLKRSVTLSAAADNQ